MQKAFQSWLEGADIPEYYHAGQEVDVFYVLYGGHSAL
jgi:hypothetical protein